MISPWDDGDNEVSPHEAEDKGAGEEEVEDGDPHPDKDDVGVNEALSSGEPKPIISNVARGPKARGQHWKLLAEAHHLINSL